MNRSTSTLQVHKHTVLSTHPPLPTPCVQTRTLSTHFTHIPFIRICTGSYTNVCTHIYTDTRYHIYRHTTICSNMCTFPGRWYLGMWSFSVQVTGILGKLHFCAVLFLFTFSTKLGKVWLPNFDKASEDNSKPQWQ